jgi:hypothetical protein
MNALLREGPPIPAREGPRGLIYNHLVQSMTAARLIIATMQVHRGWRCVETLYGAEEVLDEMAPLVFFRAVRGVAVVPLRSGMI